LRQPADPFTRPSGILSPEARGEFRSPLADRGTWNVEENENLRRRRRLPAYPWVVVGLLWFCGFFNYADRQALSGVVVLIQREFLLNDAQLGVVLSAFMVVYALASPFTGYTVDLLSRRLLIAVGLAFWSVICAATALSRNFWHLVLLRGSEGLGESFYFPASMSILADYHGPRTRSRAMSTHQTSVYVGTAGGWIVGSALGESLGWRSPFWALGVTGMLYALLLFFCLAEPARSRTKPENKQKKELPDELDLIGEGEVGLPAISESLLAKILRILMEPAAAVLLVVFIGANFVAATFLAWLPAYIFRNFELPLGRSGLASMFWPLASVPGAILGGILADWAARRSRGGRICVQSAGLILAAPFVYLTGVSSSLPALIVGLAGAGLCKGVYDANIFAALYDVVAPEDRGTAAGLMNTVGWIGGFAAPMVIGVASAHYGLGLAITATAAVYLLVGLVALLAAVLVNRKTQLGT
jgi:MFS family permease